MAWCRLATSNSSNHTNSIDVCKSSPISQASAALGCLMRSVFASSQVAVHGESKCMRSSTSLTCHEMFHFCCLCCCCCCCCCCCVMFDECCEVNNPSINIFYEIDLMKNMNQILSWSCFVLCSRPSYILWSSLIHFQMNLIFWQIVSKILRSLIKRP